MLNQILPTINTVVMATLTAMIGYIGAQAVKVVPSIVDNIVARVGLTKYKHYKLIAQDIWYIVDEYFRLHPEDKKGIEDKINMFAVEIRKKIPGITDEQIEQFRQALAGEINKDKPAIEKALEEPKTVQVTPTIKYFTSDGTELQPVNNVASGTPVA